MRQGTGRQATNPSVMCSSRPGTHFSIKINRFLGFLLPQQLVICFGLEKKTLSPLLPHSSKQSTMETLPKQSVTNRDGCSGKHRPALLRAPFLPPHKPWAIHKHPVCTLAQCWGTPSGTAQGGDSHREGVSGTAGPMTANTWGSAPATATFTPTGMNPHPGWRGGMWMGR